MVLDLRLYFYNGKLTIILCVVNCQKACKKCDDQRPCERCTKYGLEDTCRDSERKERKKGVKRGPYSRVVEDGDTDESDPVSSSRWSEDNQERSVNLRLTYKQEGTTPAEATVSGKYWNVPGGAVPERRMRSARQRVTRYDEEAFYSSPVQQTVKPVLHVGAPDSTYIKTLGMVCTEVLRKIEEEDMPPAVTYSEWPPRMDKNFPSVDFIEMVLPVVAAEESVPLLQPLPIQRSIYPAVFEQEMDFAYSRPSSPVENNIHPGSDLPHYTVMTPPETPVSSKLYVQLPPVQQPFIHHQ